MPKTTPLPFTSAKPLTIRALNRGKNPKKIRLTAEPAGDPGIYQEIVVGAYRGKTRIADVLVGLDGHGNLRVLCSVDNDGSADPAFCIFPEAGRKRAFYQEVVDYPHGNPTAGPTEYLAEFAQAIRDWIGDSNPRTREGKILRRDAKDLQAVLDLIKAKKFNEARMRAQQLDTAVRDEIPDGVWTMLLQPSC